jgi:hypothetical protein
VASTSAGAFSPHTAMARQMVASSKRASSTRSAATSVAGNRAKPGHLRQAVGVDMVAVDGQVEVQLTHQPRQADHLGQLGLPGWRARPRCERSCTPDALPPLRPGPGVPAARRTAPESAARQSRGQADAAAPAREPPIARVTVVRGGAVLPPGWAAPGAPPLRCPPGWRPATPRSPRTAAPVADDLANGRLGKLPAVIERRGQRYQMPPQPRRGDVCPPHLADKQRGGGFDRLGQPGVGQRHSSGRRLRRMEGTDKRVRLPGYCGRHTRFARGQSSRKQPAECSPPKTTDPLSSRSRPRSLQ